MAAYAAITSLMHTMDQLHNHPSPPISLDTQQVESLNEIAAFLQQFLEAYNSPFAYSDEADPLEIRIMNAAYAAEDAIESHIVKVIKESTNTYYKQTYHLRPIVSNSCKTYYGVERESNFVQEVSCINLYEDLHQLIEEMDSIKKVAMKIFFDGAGKEKEVVPDFSSRSSSTEQRHNTTMVCFDDVLLLEILEKLVSGSLRRQVIPITGMGGIGKTTLATTVYLKPLVIEYFDICVWVTISQKFNTREILRELLCQATNKTKEDVEDDVGLALHKYLFGRRFLIVMDDMWNIDAWDQIQRFFPDNENGSRVLVTTRLSRLSSQLTSDYSLKMKFLDGIHSWELFSKTVFGEESFPLELEEIGEKIVHDCKGLPLSIIVVGGVLKKVEHTRECWESIRNDLTSVVNLENDEHCLRLLKLSYNHLPAYLKPCFLYMGVFEEDHEIRVSMLVKLWVSEGFLKPMNGKSLETTAQGFLKDLIDRNLILIDGLKRSGDIKYCKIHDLLRDLCLREAHKYGFYDIMEECSIREGINRQRRLVMHERDSLFYDYELQSLPLARSIIFDCEIIPSCQKFGLLRILHACKLCTHVETIDVDALEFQVPNMRHFVGKVFCISPFLSSIILVWNLHTLIVDCFYACEAPIEIWKMAQFRHIEFKTEPLYLPDPPDERDDDTVVVMENLQMLKGLKNFKCGEEVLKRCPNLKKLGIRYDEYHDYSLVNIQYLSKLESLVISCEFIFNGIDSLHELTFPNSLKSLSLDFPNTIHDLEGLLEKIGSLPLLQKLRLKGGCFITGKWEVGEDQFPSLKYLSLTSCRGLKQWTTAQEESSIIFPRLEHLCLSYVQELEKLPCEIGDIATLQKIELENCSESMVMSARDIVDEQVELQGDEDLSFHVLVRLLSNQKALGRSLAGPHFEVRY